MKPQHGFTFIELMMTLAIMAVLAMVSLPLAEKANQRSKERELLMALTQIREAIDAYKRSADAGHIELAVGESGYPRSLDDLVNGVTDQKSPTGKKIYFLRSLPADPTFPDKSAAPAATWGLRAYDSDADAPKAGRDVFDVYSFSSGVAADGVPYRKW